MNEKKLNVLFSAPLNELNIEVKTYDYRTNNQIFVLLIQYKAIALLHLMIVFVTSFQEHGKSSLLR